MGEKHYVVGAGMVGCLYDYGPNAYETFEDAMEDVKGYIEDIFSDDDAENEALDAMVKECLATMAELGGSYYFPRELRAVIGADYIEISTEDGPCPRSEG